MISTVIRIKAGEYHMNKVIQMMTDFIFLEDVPQKADIIMIPGSGYGALADTAAALWHQSFAPLILPSGKYSKLIGHFEGTFDNHYPVSNPAPENECDYLSALLIDNNVASSAILREPQATYTYENAIFSKQITDTAQLDIHTAILCCQAFHARRCLMYYQLLYPNTRFIICPTVTQDISKDNWYLSDEKIDKVLGEIERCGSQFHEILRELNATF